jgi:hypothetical protein
MAGWNKGIILKFSLKIKHLKLTTQKDRKVLLKIILKILRNLKNIKKIKIIKQNMVFQDSKQQPKQ